MDLEQLHKDIKSALPSDPISTPILANPTSEPDSRWSIDPEGFVRKDDKMYVPDSEDLRLSILQYKHDHPTAGHFGQSKTLDLIARDYFWPLIRTSIKDFCKSCTACARAKVPRHRPYGMLKQLPIPEKPWNSISMDFIEKLPTSSSFTSILVIIEIGRAHV